MAASSRADAGQLPARPREGRRREAIARIRQGQDRMGDLLEQHMRHDISEQAYRQQSAEIDAEIDAAFADLGRIEYEEHER